MNSNRRLFAITINNVVYLNVNAIEYKVVANTETFGLIKLMNNSFSYFCTESILFYDECVKKWKKKRNLQFLEKIPYFIVFISFIEVILYYLTDDKIKQRLVYDPENNKEIWRFVTYIFVHKDCVHLFINVIIQGFVSFPLEFEQGNCKCVAVFFSGGLAGSLGVATFSTPTLMVGASGGIYGLLTSHVPNIILNHETIKHFWYRIIAVITISLSDVVQILYHVWCCNNENPKIGWPAHLSGAVSGLIVGFLIFSGNSKWKKKFQTLSAIMLLVIIIIMIAIYNFRRIF